MEWAGTKIKNINTQQLIKRMNPKVCKHLSGTIT